jgi:site-specific DNA-methyltransferase (adenine-specific)
MSFNTTHTAPSLPAPTFDDPKHHLRLYQGDCLDILAAIPPSSVDLVFADPPYFLSNGGITCHAGKMVSVHKGDWDKSRGPESNHEFNRAWLAACQRILKPNGSIWVSGTAHVIHSVGFAMQQLGFKLLNDISWVKPNPPPNLSCRYFTHATETIIWAAKDKKSRHTFHYKLMKETNRGKQMKSVWEIRPPESWEKRFGKHPTQKPVALLERILLASTNEGDFVLDPFAGSGTTLLTAFRLRRHALGCELNAEFLSLSIRRLCSEMVQIELFVSRIEFPLDLDSDPMDRSNGAADSPAQPCSGRASARLASASERPGLCSGRGPSRAAFDFSCMPAQLQLVQQERRFYFIGRSKREILFTTLADSLDEARQKFRNAGHPDSDALFIIKTETEIYLA